MKKIYLALIVAGFINVAIAQTGSVGIGTASPNASAALDATWKLKMVSAGPWGGIL